MRSQDTFLSGTPHSHQLVSKSELQTTILSETVCVLGFQQQNTSEVITVSTPGVEWEKGYPVTTASQQLDSRQEELRWEVGTETQTAIRQMPKASLGSSCKLLEVTVCTPPPTILSPEAQIGKRHWHWLVTGQGHPLTPTLWPAAHKISKQAKGTTTCPVTRRANSLG